MPAQRKATALKKHALREDAAQPDALVLASEAVSSLAQKPAPVPEKTYQVTLEFESSNFGGNLQEHLELPESTIKGLLAGKIDFIRLPDRPSGFHQKEARFASLWSIQEIHIFGWPDEGEDQ